MVQKAIVIAQKNSKIIFATEPVFWKKILNQLVNSVKFGL